MQWTISQDLIEILFGATLIMLGFMIRDFSFQIVWSNKDNGRVKVSVNPWWFVVIGLLVLFFG